MNTVCNKDACTGCMACIECCARKAITIEDNMLTLNAVIDTDKCVNCGLCRNVCQVNYPLKKTEPIRWYEGWTKDSTIRVNSTSGGFATAIMESFINSGGEVCSCIFCDGEFYFKLAQTVVEAKEFAGSKYCKSNPQSAFKLVKSGLEKGHKILFIGLPCQVAGIKKYIKPELQNRFYTVDLICHGTPSIKVLDRFLKDEGIERHQLKDLRFRCKSNETKDGYKIIGTQNCVDAYTYTFLNRVIFTENCYSCAYANTERVSDLTLGDSWGSKETAEVSKGISLALCQNEKGLELLNNADLVLLDVDIENAIGKNAQLRGAASRSEKRDLFFSELNRGQKYGHIVSRCFPLNFMKHGIKKLLIKTQLMKGERSPYQIQYLKDTSPLTQ